jgi:hypothetical protein
MGTAYCSVLSGTRCWNPSGPPVPAAPGRTVEWSSNRLVLVIELGNRGIGCWVWDKRREVSCLFLVVAVGWLPYLLGMIVVYCLMVGYSVLIASLGKPDKR